jgi:hypothetical protein
MRPSSALESLRAQVRQIEGRHRRAASVLPFGLTDMDSRLPAWSRPWRAGDDKSVLACFEEGLRHGGLGAVVAEVARLPMTASRRLHLAAEGSGTIGMALRRAAGAGFRAELDECRDRRPIALVGKQEAQLGTDRPGPRQRSASG